MTAIILPVPHVQQDEADCLAACAAMVLAYHDIHIRYKRLLKQLDVKWHGTPFSNLSRLDRIVDVEIGKHSADILINSLNARLPVIVSVHTSELYYHEEKSGHALVVVGMDAENDTIFVNDPILERPYFPLTMGDFYLAWIMQKEQYAILTPR